MRVLRWIGIVLALLVLALLGVALAARVSDGPLGPFPGGPLKAGRLVETPVDDWSFAGPAREIELQLVEPPRSRTTWILVLGGRAYVPCGFPELRIWKQWPHEALVDGRGVVRIGGERYPVLLKRVEDPKLQRALAEQAREKYPESRRYSGEIWYFELTPPAAAAGGEASPRSAGAARAG